MQIDKNYDSSFLFTLSHDVVIRFTKILIIFTFFFFFFFFILVLTIIKLKKLPIYQSLIHYLITAGLSSQNHKIQPKINN